MSTQVLDNLIGKQVMNSGVYQAWELRKVSGSCLHSFGVNMELGLSTNTYILRGEMYL